MINKIKEYFSKNKLMAIFPVLALTMIIPVLVLGLASSKDIRSKAAVANCTEISPCVGFINKVTVPRTKISNFFFQNMALKSIRPIDFNSYLNKKVAIVGNVVAEKTGKSLYVSSIRFFQTTTPFPTPVSCTLISKNCGPGPCGDQSLGAYSCEVGSRCMVNNCYPTNRACIVDQSCIPPSGYSYKCIFPSGKGPSCSLEQGTGGYPTLDSCKANCGYPNLSPTPKPTPYTDSYKCLISNGIPNCVFGPGPGYSSIQACMANCIPPPPF